MRLLLLSLGFLFAFSLPANPCNLFPPPFEGVLYAAHDGTFYDQQAAAWEALATSDCGTDEAWWNYYKTAHYSNRFGNGTYDLSAILLAAEKVCDPNGFDLQYLRFAHEKEPVKRHAHLLKARDADPNRLEAGTGLSTYYTVNGQIQKRNDILRRMHQAKPLPAGVIEYNYNQLESVAPNGILITHGDADTYPSWLLQSAYGVREDVLVVNLHLLVGYESYRSHIQEQLGVEQLFATTTRTAEGLLQQLVTYERPVFLAATARPLIKDLPADQLYLTGLAFRYSPLAVNNLKSLSGNYGNWRLEKLRYPFDESPRQRVADGLNKNYLPALLELYEAAGEKPGSPFAEVLPLIHKIADRAGVREKIDEFLSEQSPPELASQTPGLRAKEIMKKLVYLPAGTVQMTSTPGEPVSVNGFFAQTTEVSNADYQLFLEDLLRQRKFDLLERVKISELDLKDYLPETHVPKELGRYLAGGHPAYADYPVVHLSHEAAELYAAWLTQVYNQDEKRKDGRNVRFRLPTTEEFVYAARGAKHFAPYPWGGPYYRNSKGCFLANFNSRLEPEAKDIFGDKRGQLSMQEQKSLNSEKNRTRQGEGCDDGGEFTVKVDAYYPNDYGLYNMSGNVAEMLAEDGKIMGGSWLDRAYEMQIGVVTERALPHPSTGFRLVMTYER